MKTYSTKQDLLNMIQRYEAGTASNKERIFIDEYYAFFDKKNYAPAPLSEQEHKALEKQIEGKLLLYIDEDREVRSVILKPVNLWKRIAAARIAAARIAAAILLVIGASLFFYNRYTNTLRHPELVSGPPAYANDIKPGSNKAYLTLANGKRLSLTDAANGAIAKEAGAEITKTADGQVVYASHNNNGDISGRHPESVMPAQAGTGPRNSYSNALNTIETPKGGQYQIRLPDGSKVWLNAASKLTYPVSFTGRGQREVTLSGEAYFEIAKDKQHPFHVKSTAQDIEVLGTHFNVNTYPDEPTTKTTLLEGSVKVAINGGISGRHPEFISGSPPTVKLKPGEQASLQGNKIKVTEVDANEAIAWKNGDFKFNDEKIESIMRKISRWYNVDVVYEGERPTNEYNAEISRFKNIDQVLNILGGTKTVHFKVIGRQVIVTK